MKSIFINPYATIKDTLKKLDRTAEKVLLIVNEDRIYLETEYKDYINKMQVHQSKENQLFYDYMWFLGDQRKKSTQLKNELKELKKGSKKFDSKSESIKAIDKEVEDYIQKIIIEKSEFFYAKLLKSNKETRISKNSMRSSSLIGEGLLKYFVSWT
jgi:hypothetical protein